MRLAVVLPLLLICGVALADGPTIADTFLTGLMPYIVAAVGAVIAAAATAVVAIVNKYTKAKLGVEISADQRQRFTTALTNAAAGLIQKYGSAGALAMQSHHGPVIDAAEELSRRIPDVLQSLGITPDTLSQRILEKIPQVLPVEVPAPVVVAPPLDIKSQ